MIEPHLFDLEPEAPTAPDDNARALRMIALISELSGDRHLAAALAELGHVDLGDADEQHWLHGPLVVHSSAWNADLPDWCKRQAMAERWQIVAGELPGHIVGPTEIVCVMMGATYDHPLHRDASDMYLWAAMLACVSHYGAKSPQGKAAVENCEKHLTDDEFLKPGGRHYYAYREFASEIRRKVARSHRDETRGRAREQREVKAETKAVET